MNNLLRSLAGLISRFHNRALAVIVFVTALSVVMLWRIELKPDIMDVLPAKNPAIETFTGFLKDFGTTDNLTIVLESKTARADEYFELAANIAARLQESGLVDYVDYNALSDDYSAIASRFPLYLDAAGLTRLKERLSKEGIARQISRNRSRLLSPLASPMDAELIARDPLNIRQIAMASAARSSANASAGKQGFYVSKDNSILLIFVKPVGVSRDIKFLKTFSRKVGVILVAAKKDAADPADLNISLAGPYAFAMEANSRLLPEVVINAVASALLVLFLFKFIFRKRLIVAAVAAATLATALAWTLGAAYLIFGSLNMVSSVVTAMLMGLGIDYIIHIFSRCEDEYRSGADMNGALTTALTRTAPGVITGALTTAAAFFCIMTTSFKGLHNLGIVAGIGVLACLASTLLVMTSIMVLMEKKWPGRLFSDKRQGFATARAARLIDARPGLIVALSAVLLAIAGYGLTGLRFDSSPESIGLKESAAARAESLVASRFGKRGNPLVIIAAGPDDQTLLKRYSALEEAVLRWKNSGVIKDASSVSVFLPTQTRQNEALAAIRAIRRTITVPGLKKTMSREIKQNGFVYQPGYDDYVDGIIKALSIVRPMGFETLEANNGKRIRFFYNKEERKTAAYIFPNGARWEPSALSTVASDTAGLGAGFEITGAAIMFASLKTAIIRESAVASAISFALIFIILYTQFKSVKTTMLVLVPLGAGMAATLGLMGILRLPLNFINVAAVPLLLGIGVDYGVYFMQDHLEVSGTAGCAVERVGAAVIMCALTTIAGFGSLATMAFKGMASLGIIISIGVTACLLGAVFLMPAIIRCAEKRRLK